ncbi:autotransporter adhesin family protein [Breznakiella homolactica]|uniref:Uncharacterized protein n=1 Tax=Breznakiella homolactica TaxID=2798577 RepID=A0A7T7XNN2_9SPIR|nr:autotransporter adhesin family protein [Breznakiella homolactica]QQO09568.1 autotransporter adhesin family protein [Breznakiella homolactica]
MREKAVFFRLRPQLPNNKTRKIRVFLRIAAAGILIPAALLLSACDVFNLSVPEYIDEYVNSAAAEQLLTIYPPPVHIKSDGTQVIRPGSEATVLTLRLRNPRLYDIDPLLDDLGGSAHQAWTGTQFAEPNLVKVVLGQAADFPIIGDEYYFLLRLKEIATGRDFAETYELPRICYNDFPSGMENVQIQYPNVRKTVKFSWNQDLEGTVQDAGFLKITCAVNGGAEKTWEFTRDGSYDWTPAAADPLIRMSPSTMVSASPHTRLYDAEIDNPDSSITSFSCEFVFTNKDELESVTELSGNHAVMMVKSAAPSDEIYYENLGSALSALSAGDTAEITILKDIQTAAGYTIDNSKTVTILADPNGSKTVEITGRGSLFTVQSGAKLILGEAGAAAGLTLKGNKNNNMSVVVVNSLGKIELNDKVRITGNNISFYAGGLRITNGTAVLNGTAEISGNSTTGGGGGVTIEGGTFTMNGNSRISGNSASGNSGGGLWISGTASTPVTMTMNDSSVISGNYTNSFGGGAYIIGVAAFIMNGGTIGGTAETDANTARLDGGGLCFDSSRTDGKSFTMSGNSIISGNTALGGGGGVHVGANTTFTMSGGSVGKTLAGGGRGNTAANNGGGVSISGGTVNMSGTANISGNHASQYGGGAYLGNPSVGGTTFNGNLTMSGTSAIGLNSGNNGEGNTALDGGGVYRISGSVFNQGTGTVSGNNPNETNP